MNHLTLLSAVVEPAVQPSGSNFWLTVVVGLTLVLGFVAVWPMFAIWIACWPG